MARIAQIIEPSILRAGQEIGDAVFIPIHNRGTGGMAGQSFRMQGPLVFKRGHAIHCAQVFHQADIQGVHQQIQITVTIPVHQAKLASARCPGNTGVQTKKAVLFWLAGILFAVKYTAPEESLSWQQYEVLAAFYPFEKGQLLR